MSNFLIPSIRPCGKLARPSSTLLASLLAISMATGLPAAEKQAANPGQKGQVKIVFTGDVMLDDGPGHALSINEDVFSNVASLLTPANISVCNLECVVAGHGHGTHQLKPYTFKARPETIPVLKKYFSAVSVANNHSGDYGPDGLAEEMDLLTAAGLPYFGGGKNLAEAHRADSHAAGPPHRPVGLRRFSAPFVRGRQRPVRRGLAQRERGLGRHQARPRG